MITPSRFPLERLRDKVTVRRPKTSHRWDGSGDSARGRSPATSPLRASFQIVMSATDTATESETETAPVPGPKRLQPHQIGIVIGASWIDPRR